LGRATGDRSRETGENETEVYQPIADYLSKATGKKIVYRHSDNWLSYQDGMRKGIYDLVFDGPHFVSWRMAQLKHVPLAKLPGNLAFVIFVRKDNNRINNIKDLAGRSVCGMAPPNLATLTFYNQFDNPSRQPLITEVRSFELAYQNVASGKCVAAVMRDQLLDKLNKDKDAVRVIFRSPGVPNQAFSAGPRFSADERNKIAESLLSPEARKQLPQFFGRYSKEKDLLPAHDAEFRDLMTLLKDSWGF
jgi:ABC-type phosphate/phosphonate transport system substrate-binding protein